MQEQDTINILISQILSKDDELVCLRQDNARIREEQRAIVKASSCMT